MKKIVIGLFLFLSSSAFFAQENVTFQAEIANRNGDVLFINNNQNKPFQEIKVDEKGVFKATFPVTEGFYILSDGTEYAQIYLKPGYDLKLKMNAKEFDESISYTGTGAGENNFIAKKSIDDEGFYTQSLLELDEKSFDEGLDKKKKKDLELVKSSKLDANFAAKQTKMIEDNINGVKAYYKGIQEKKLLNNKPSSPFDYVNYAGGTTKLSDFKGKYVYIDIWATWCGPCRAEIPSLKKVEEKYHGKNIVFVSISVDTDKDFEKWKTFVKEKELGGVQLFADKNWNSDFMKSYNVTSIPRFILLDPSGNILSADAERPSNPNLQTKLDQFLK
jgi:thiol-disulfide isomerase/thioredoxin